MSGKNAGIIIITSILAILAILYSIALFIVPHIINSSTFQNKAFSLIEKKYGYSISCSNLKFKIQKIIQPSLSVSTVLSPYQ